MPNPDVTPPPDSGPPKGGPISRPSTGKLESGSGDRPFGPKAGGGVLRIDGSYGEGGGQILRTTLALSAITGRPLELFNIRKGRKNPGLSNQHLACVNALAKVAQARVDGAHLGSTHLLFVPQAVQAGEFVCDVAQERGSAGSVTLILQALLPVLCTAPGISHVILRGGTHVPWSPPVHYVQAVLLPMLGKLGVNASIELLKAGWYPKGGGEIHVSINPAPHLVSHTWNDRGTLRRITGVSLISNLARTIAERQRRAVLLALHTKKLDAKIECIELPSPGKGSCVVLVAEFDSTHAGFAALGERGKPAEQVGQEAAQALLEYLGTSAALEEHLADQILIFLALASGASSFVTSRVTRHLLTNLWTIQECLPICARLRGTEGAPGEVDIRPTA